ncbi:MAG: lipase [Verrucomicrobiaceae bacterium TMED137]|jgi:acetyl esterase/lipase|nr:MAG: lipase [Verrucomicrobiaceae bacterium TMED137]HAE18245.1 lipase [Verrucomicrobiales bacterium]HBI33290.1 lipase [Verrucomicrobiales bacterium]HCN81318.1 lipase [Verrucomicrobiales bacterium]
MRTIILLFISTLQIWAAQSEYKIKEDIPYRENTQALDEYQQERCLLDIHYPSSKGFATIIWFHGGGLTSGEKSFPKALQNKGHAIVAVNYRLSPKVKVTECLDDAAAAVAWVMKNIRGFGGDRKRIFISGHSAGGYLTSMIGLDSSWLKRHQEDANDIAGLIPYSGHAITHFTVRKERGIAATRPIVDELAPLFHVRKDAPPILLITGDREKELLGRYEENAYLFRMLKVSGHQDVTLFEIDGYGHGMTDPAHPLLLKFVKRIRSKK